ncbi:Putative kynurenine formamidase/cyclase, kynurenine formamidase superfamily [Colletotrichum destructivum]|uniref:Kynurenine formamidase/cyclase, kynurenine formamidase superfamily n=1 Tax=Colletotrichum destructivum TaxID=34406 RepID=A0AAX4I9J1_9PEZI|nr:Putative kynurenine formamidase/cyclase, kynurenine formamidase superfamily [Colletotrichum destructivum]
MAPPTPDFLLNENGIPPFDALPLGRDDPRFSAWGLYGDNDELGTLNRLTDERVAAAARNEIRTGARVSLNWSMTAQPAPFFARRAFHHDLFRKHPRFVNDDVWTFNSQSSSQWDGLRHFGYQKEERFYNGVSMDEVHAVDEAGRRSTVNGIQAWQKHGIVGRGILVDYHTWRLERQIPYDPFARDSIPVSDLKTCLEAQGTEVKFGDILLTRTGFMTAHAGKSAEDLETYRAATPQTFGGVAQSEETLRWVWDNFSAVGGDQPSFECWPHRDPEHWMHEVLLAGWGMPIGELFDLEALAERCRREGRWSFFVVSEPCNVPGGVASPPNILAIF